MQRKKKRVKKAPPLNRQEPWFLGRDYSTTSFTQLHQVNKYNHAVEGLEVLRNYTGRQNELDRRINEQNGKQDDLYGAPTNDMMTLPETCHNWDAHRTPTGPLSPPSTGYT